MTTHHYNLTVDSLRHIPGDILVEHLGYALKAFQDEDGNRPHIHLDDYVASGPEKVNYREGRQHPFDGPELFDDDEPESEASFAEFVEDQLGIPLMPHQREAFNRMRDDRPEVYLDGGPYEGVQYVDATPIGSKERVNIPGPKATIFELSDSDKALLNRAIATDFPHLAELFNAKREAQ